MEEEKGVKAASAESETETKSDKGAEAPFTSGLQFSAYSRQPQTSYNDKKPQPAGYNAPPPPPRRADQILYGLDPQGKPVYMDAADVAELLGTPKAKKVDSKVEDFLVLTWNLAGYDHLLERDAARERESNSFSTPGAF